MKKELNNASNPIALLPILVFLILYLGLGILFEYVMKINMGFYSIPIVVAFMAAILVACLQNRGLKFDEKLSVMAKGVGDKNIMTMILIFLTAGIFVGVLGRSSAASAAYFLLSIVPAQFSVAILFLVSCLTCLWFCLWELFREPPLFSSAAQPPQLNFWQMPAQGRRACLKPLL